MARIQIYTAGTGTLQYDSAGRESGENPVVRKEYNHGINFLIDTENEEVHCYFNASRKAPEQFMAIYRRERHNTAETGNPAALLRECKREIESTVAELGWQLLGDNPGQEWFTALDQTQKTQPDLRWEVLDGKINSKELFEITAEPYEFASPSPTASLEFVRYLLSEGVRGRIAVGKGNPRKVHNDLKYAITVDKSVTSNKLAGETLQQIRNAELSQLKQDASDSVSSLVQSASNIKRKQKRSSKIVTSLNAAGFDHLGVMFEHPPSTKRRKLRTAVQYALGGFSLCLLIGVIVAIVMGWTGTISDLLFNNYTLRELGLDVLPRTDGGIGGSIVGVSLPSWFVLAGTGALLVTHTSTILSEELDRISSFLIPGSQSTAGQIRRSANTVQSRTANIYKHPLVDGTDDLVRQLNQSVLRHSKLNINARNATEVKGEIQKLRILGVAIGIVVAILLGAVGYFSVDLLSENWQTIIKITFLAALLMGVIHIGRFLLIVGTVIGGVLGSITSSGRKGGRSGSRGGRGPGSNIGSSSNNRLPLIIFIIIIIVLVSVFTITIFSTLGGGDPPEATLSDLDIAGQDETATLENGTNFNITVSVAHDGGQSGRFTVTLTIGEQIQQNKSTIELGGNRSAQTVEFNHVTRDLDDGTHNVTVTTENGNEPVTGTLNIEETDSGSDDPDTELPADKASLTALNIAGQDENASINESGDANISVEVENVGEQPASFEVLFNISSDTVSEERSNMTEELSAGQRETVSFENVTGDLTAGEYSVTVSTENSTLTGILTIKRKQVPGESNLTALNIAGQGESASINGSEGANVSVKIKNIGEQSESFEVRLEVPIEDMTGSISQRESTEDLSGGGNETVVFGNVAENLDPGKYNVTVSTDADTVNGSLTIGSPEQDQNQNVGETEILRRPGGALSRSIFGDKESSVGLRIKKLAMT